MSRRAHGGPDARALAHEVLVQVETAAAFADVLLTHRLGRAELAVRDRALATELVYGTLVWQGRLDHHLRSLLHEPLERLDPPVRAALRLGLFQLLMLDRIPAYAAVDASVRLSGRRASGLVNAVLRRAARAGRAGLALPDATADPVERLSVEWSHPRWLVERWIAELGHEDTTRLLAANDAPPDLSIRTNRRRTTREALQATLADAGIVARPGTYAPDALVVSEGAHTLRDTKAWRDGLFSYQGEASQLVAALVDGPGLAHVLDVCAAPGGKTLAVAERLGDSGRRVVALDQNRVGLGRLPDEARRLGIEGVLRIVGDARELPFTRTFDAVLVDAPCSGLGTLRRHPELKWRRRPDDIGRLAALQREIVASAAGLVRPGGLLVYAVCTRTREETVAVVDWLVETSGRFVVEPLAMPGIDADGMLRIAPHTHGLDGFFAARLRARR